MIINAFGATNAHQHEQLIADLMHKHRKREIARSPGKMGRSVPAIAEQMVRYVEVNGGCSKSEVIGALGLCHRRANEAIAYSGRIEVTRLKSRLALTVRP